MVGEVGLAYAEQTFDGRLQFVIDPNATHRIVNGRENHHRGFVRIVIDNFFVHLEQVAILLFYHIFAQAFDGVFEVQINRQTRSINAETGIATLFGCTRSHVARHQVAERRIATLQIEIAVFVGNVGRFFLAGTYSLSIFFLFRHPNAAIVAQRFRHQRQFRLEFAVYRNTCRVNLCKTRICEIGTFAIHLHGSRTVRSHSVGRKEERVAIAARANNDCMSEETFDFARHQIACNDAACPTVDNNHIQHFVACVHFHRTFFNLTAQCRIGAQQQLLAGLSFGIERARHLCATERTIVEQAAVFTRKRHTLRHTLVDNIVRHFGQAIHIGFAGAIVATLNRVVEQTIHRVAIILIVFSRIDTALCSDRMRTARRILNAEIQHIKPEFAQRGSCRSAGKSRTNDNNVETAFVGRIHQFLVCLVICPFFGQRSFRNFGSNILVVSNDRFDCFFCSASHFFGSVFGCFDSLFGGFVLNHFLYSFAHSFYHCFNSRHSRFYRTFFFLCHIIYCVIYFFTITCNLLPTTSRSSKPLPQQTSTLPTSKRCCRCT